MVERDLMHLENLLFDVFDMRTRFWKDSVVQHFRPIASRR